MEIYMITVCVRSPYFIDIVSLFIIIIIFLIITIIVFKLFIEFLKILV